MARPRGVSNTLSDELRVCHVTVTSGAVLHNGSTAHRLEVERLK
jgi:hypothetical protein